MPKKGNKLGEAYKSLTNGIHFKNIPQQSKQLIDYISFYQNIIFNLMVIILKRLELISRFG